VGEERMMCHDHWDSQTPVMSRAARLPFWRPPTPALRNRDEDDGARRTNYCAKGDSGSAIDGYNRQARVAADNMPPSAPARVWWDVAPAGPPPPAAANDIPLAPAESPASVPAFRKCKHSRSATQGSIYVYRGFRWVTAFGVWGARTCMRGVGLLHVDLLCEVVHRFSSIPATTMRIVWWPSKCRLGPMIWRVTLIRITIAGAALVLLAATTSSFARQAPSGDFAKYYVYYVVAFLVIIGLTAAMSAVSFRRSRIARPRQWPFW
jgi:hypothetical protein